MSSKSKFTAEDLRFARILDEAAERWLLHHVPLLQSPFLSRQTLDQYQVGGEQKRMVDSINLVITATQLNGAPAGFIAAQVDCDQAISILHMVYVLPSVRQRGVAQLLIEVFESTMVEVDCSRVTAAVTNKVSRHLLNRVASRSKTQTYTIKEATRLSDEIED